MLATLASATISEWNLNSCCFCLDHSIGVLVIAFVHIIQFVTLLVLNLIWINHSHFNEECFGPLQLDIIKANCTGILEYQSLGRDHYFENLTEELKRLSAYFQEFKMSYVSTLLMVIILNLTSAGSGILLVFGVLLKRKVLIIPWLIIGEVMVVFYFTFMIVIIFIEAKLFGVGKSVFGLFSVIFLCLAFVQAYLWIVVQSLYCRFDKEELTKEENMKLFKSDTKMRGTGAIVKHHIPDFSRGHINQAYLRDDIIRSPYDRHSRFNNGHAHFVARSAASKFEAASETIEAIPMETFGKNRSRNQNVQIVLDPANLQKLD